MAAVPEPILQIQRDAVSAVVAQHPLVVDLGEVFHRAGHELALVGGVVRDAVMGGKLSPDVDLTTSAGPQEVHDLLSDWAEVVWDTGIRFGTVGARRNDVTWEVTTYRSDSYDPSSRKPEVRFGSSLGEDLLRRDFTVNAMAIRLPDMRFVDPSNGLIDLSASRLCTPRSPAESFSDDPLRMMRAARFVSQLGLSVPAAVERDMEVMADRLGIVSPERRQQELTRLLLGGQPTEGLDLLVRTGLAEHVLPELPALRLEIDEHHRHKDVYEHSLTVLDQAIGLERGEPDLVLRLAAIMHDIGKPDTRRFEAGGRVSFHHHEMVGARLTRKRLRALRYSKEIVEAVSGLVELHLRFHGYGTGQWSDSAVRRYVRDAGPLLERLHKLTRADCTTRNQRRARNLQRAYDDLERRIDQLEQAEELAAVRPELDGNEIMTVMGWDPGPLVGRAYRHLLEVRLDRGPIGREAAIAELRDWAESL